MSFISSLYTHISSIFSKAENASATYAEDFAKSSVDLAKKAGPQALAVIEQGVATAELSGGTGAQKKSAALDFIRGGLEGLALSLLAREVETLLQMAVAKLRDLQASVTPAS